MGGIVVVRSGADTRTVIESVKERLEELQVGLPEEVEISIAYDRTNLIDRAVETLTHTLLEESIVVALVCLVFLFHFRSALVAIISIPVSILLAFIVMKIQGIGANIMSLGGIAISIGVLVDAAIVMVENAHKHYEEWQGKRPHLEIITRAAQEVGPTLFFTLLVITVSFLPVFTLEAQEGRLFKPLAFTKTYTMAMASILAVTAVPVLMYWFVRGKISPRRPPSGVTSPPISLHATPQLGLAMALGGDPRHGRYSRRHPCSTAEDRLRVHATPVGGRPALHAYDVSGHFHHQSEGAPAADRQDHQDVSRGRNGLWKGRACRDRDRSGSTVDDRNDHRAQGSIGVAARSHQGRSGRRARPGHPDTRLDQRLDHADQDSDRHAVDRHQDHLSASRSQGPI